LEREKVEFFAAVRQGYLELAAAEPERFLVIDATSSKEQIQAQIQARVAELLK
jgi:dTMP kinase